MRKSQVKVAGNALALAMLAALAGCGGGGGGGAGGASQDANGQPTQPLTTYVASGEGGIGSTTVQVDANGVFKLEDTTLTLQNTGASGCSLTSSPADSEPTVCNRFADGKAYLFCSGTSAGNFDAVMFRQADVQAATLGELGGATLAGLACGANGPRTTADKLAFNSDSSIAVLTQANSTLTYGSGVPASLVQANGAPGTGSQREHWAIYKVAAGGGTQYFLLDLWQADDPAAGDHPATMYFLQK